jgi:hypothetical protein
MARWIRTSLRLTTKVKNSQPSLLGCHHFAGLSRLSREFYGCTSPKQCRPSLSLTDQTFRTHDALGRFLRLLLEGFFSCLYCFWTVPESHRLRACGGILLVARLTGSPHPRPFVSAQ